MPSYRRTEGERLLALEDEVAKLKTALSRRDALNTVAGGDFTIMNDGTIQSSNFDGDLDVPSVGTQGWAMGGPFGAAAIATLLLRPGSVTNDALTNPVTLGSNGQAAAAFAVPTTSTAIVTRTITVPVGYSQAIVMANGTLSAVESSGTPDYLYFTVLINGTGSAEAFSVAGANSGTSLSNSSVRTLSGLSGGVITFTGNIHSLGHAWTAQVSNTCTINAMAVFLR
jgi:hypothetical protein